MEKSLEKHMTNTCHNHGVTGILCVDRNGFCLGVKGDADPKSAGSLSAIAKDAEKILPDEDTPIISIESSSTNILVKAKEGYTTAIYKKSS